MCCAAAFLLAAPAAHSDVPAALKALASGDFKTAAEHLRPLAEAGDASAQIALGRVLRTPANPHRAPEEALSWFSRAAEQGNTDAQFWLGVMHRLGEGVARDTEQANRLWRSAAEAGSSRAQGALAQSLWRGDGIARDPDEALGWARKGAEQGNALAQSVLAQAHLTGEGGVNRSLSEFLRWTHRAANQGNRPSMEALAVSYQTGAGVTQNFVQAHMWANLAAARGSARAMKLRDELAAKMTAEQIAEAQKSASRWRPTAAAAAQGQRGSAETNASGKRRTGSGSGFIVALPGYVLTNDHVINQCTEIRAPAHKAVLRVVARDETNDLALLEGEFAVSEAARFRPGLLPRLGEPVIVAGYPLSDLLAASLNVTTGSVSALAGPRGKRNDTLFQITAPIQRGSSGGPVLDAQGDVIGVVVSKLNALKVAMATGDMPQNVNFAINGAVARAFLESSGIDLAADEPAAANRPDAPERARRFTMLLECWR